MTPSELGVAAIAIAAFVAGVAVVVERRRKSGLIHGKPTQSEVLDSIERIIDNPSAKDVQIEDPWRKVNLGETLAGATLAGEYRIDPNGNGVLASLGVVDMIWGNSNEFDGLKGKNIEAILHGLDAADSERGAKSPVLTASANGENLCLVGIDLHRADGTPFRADLWSRADVRDGELFGAEIFLLDRSETVTGTFLVDDEGVCRHASAACRTLFLDLRRDDLSVEGLNLHKHIISAPLWGAVAGGEAFHAKECELRPITGTSFPVEVRSRPIEVQNQFLGAALIVREL